MLRGIFTVFVMSVMALPLGALVFAVTPFRFSSWGQAWIANVWSRTILRCAGARLKIEGAERIPSDAGCFFVGNHQSALDIPVLFACLRGRIRFLAKESLFRIPVFGWAMKCAGHVAIARSRPRAAREQIEKTLAQVREQPISLAVFPEGTRSPDGRLLPFRKGTMKICQRAGLAIVPFTISGSLDVHKRSSLVVHPGVILVRFADPIGAEDAATASVDQLHDRVFEAVASGLVTERAAACRPAS